ncbi:MAG: hypothetical protein ACLQO7_03145 [Candidatus Bathyarchaeia archaeon]
MEMILDQLAATLVREETASTKERLLYIDNLRLLVIVRVVSIHLAVTVLRFLTNRYNK